MDYAKYYSNENTADSKRTYSQIMDLDKYLKEINEDTKKNDRKDRAKTQNISNDDPFLKDFRSKTQNLDDKQYYMNKNERTGREKDNNNDKKLKLERAKTKEPYLRDKNEDSAERYQKKKKDLEKFLGDDEYTGNRLSKMSMKNRQINEAYNKKLFEEPKKDESFFDKILTVFGCITRDKKKI